MDLDHGFSLAEPFHWEYPISPVAQESIATYGSDEDRVRLAGHFSVTVETLDALSQVSSADVRLAVANNPATSLETLARLSHDRSHSVKVAANDVIDHLPARERAAVRAMVESPMRRLRSRLGA